ncbi:hypothetical protein ACB094_01G343500 [Castanea mollissima]
MINVTIIAPKSPCECQSLVMLSLSLSLSLSQTHTHTAGYLLHGAASSLMMTIPVGGNSYHLTSIILLNQIKFNQTYSASIISDTDPNFRDLLANSTSTNLTLLHNL